MEKSPEAFRTISEVAETLELPQHVLRFWESRFPQIKPLKRGGGRRYYRPVDVELLRAIKRLLYDEGYTIKGVQKMLREQGVQGMSRPEAGPPPAAGPSQRIEPDFGRAAPAPPATRSTAEEPPFEAEPVPSRPAWNLSALRAVLEELREAERILARTRAG